MLCPIKTEGFRADRSLEPLYAESDCFLMIDNGDLEIFLAAPPGLEALLRDEAADLGFDVRETVPGGVVLRGSWREVWRANLTLRGAVRVLVRIGQMPAVHLAQLDKRARRLPWGAVLPKGAVVRVDASCKRSKIYHSGAAAQRIASAMEETAGASIQAEGDIRIFVRIEDDLCTVSIDTSGELLHKRGFKQAVGKAPLRETLAALFLRACGFGRADDQAGPGNAGRILDPMCGSGTLVIEAAEMALGLAPGRARAFAFERLAGFNKKAWTDLRLEVCGGGALPGHSGSDVRFEGGDRDAGAVRMSEENAARSGVGEWTRFRQHTVSTLDRPEGDPGLVMVNPPYGARIGDPHRLRSLYATFGRVMKDRFSGWRVGLVTSDKSLAQATDLPFSPPGPPVPHGPLRIRLYQTGPLP